MAEALCKFKEENYFCGKIKEIRENDLKVVGIVEKYWCSLLVDFHKKILFAGHLQMFVKLN